MRSLVRDTGVAELMEARLARYQGDGTAVNKAQALFSWTVSMMRSWQ